MPHPYGWSHNAERRRLLGELVDGTPCPRCGRPMWRDRPDLLDTGHATDVAQGGGDGPRRLEHGSCNRSAGARAGNRARGRFRLEVEDDEVEERPPLIVLGQGRGRQYSHDLNCYGAHVPPELRRGGWIIEVEP